jgi:hypothetical protein
MLQESSIFKFFSSVYTTQQKLKMVMYIKKSLVPGTVVCVCGPWALGRLRQELEPVSLKAAKAIEQTFGVFNQKEKKMKMYITFLPYV